jgi:Protein of unknown function (DUF819)
MQSWRHATAAALLTPLVAAQIAAALASRHIGGAVNYVAVAETLGMSAGAPRTWTLDALAAAASHTRASLRTSTVCM